MDLASLQKEYAIAKASDRFPVHKRFTKELISSNDADVIRYHYALLSDRENARLYQLVRAAFIERGEPGEAFLVRRAAEETDQALRADILHLLGRLRNPLGLKLARDAINSDDREMRHRACYVLGWMGDDEDIDLLRDRLLKDLDPYVRGTAATALRQVWFRLPAAKPRLLKALREALEGEENSEALKLIILSVQTIMEKRFGLRENIEERTITGDVDAAKKKCSQALARLGP